MCATLCILSLLAMGEQLRAERPKPPTAEQLKEITDRGRLLSEYDQAAWHASDAIQLIDPKVDRIAQYIGRKTENGWVVSFGRLDAGRDVFLVAYEAVQSSEPTEFKVKTYDPPMESTGFERAAAHGFATVTTDFKPPEGEQPRAYNVAFVPTDLDRLWVYLYPASTETGVWPVGGDVRYLISADGKKIVEKRVLHKSVIEYRAPVNKDEEQLVSGMHTHVLAETPEDTDVFLVLSREPRVPELIVTKSFVFSIEVDGKIAYVGTADEFAKKKE
jgi:hypothetical protein